MAEWYIVIFVGEEAESVFTCFCRDSLELEGENVREVLRSRDPAKKLRLWNSFSEIMNDLKKCEGTADTEFAYVWKDAGGTASVYLLLALDHFPVSWTDGLPPGCEEIKGAFNLLPM
jgi:hypothetical protein